MRVHAHGVETEDFICKACKKTLQVKRCSIKILKRKLRRVPVPRYIQENC